VPVDEPHGATSDDRLRRWAQDRCLDLSSQNVEAQDEIRCRWNRGRVHCLVARLLPGILPAANRIVRGLLKLEQPAKSVAWAFLAFTRSNHKSDRISDGPAVSRIGNRMHAGRTRDCRRDYRSYQPLRPIGCENQLGRPPAARGVAKGRQDRQLEGVELGYRFSKSLIFKRARSSFASSSFSK